MLNNPQGLPAGKRRVNSNELAAFPLLGIKRAPASELLLEPLLSIIPAGNAVQKGFDNDTAASSRAAYKARSCLFSPK